MCCLSSVNIATRREWLPVQDQFILDIATMLDNALEAFIEDAPPEMWRAVNSARAERSIGIGTLGLHTYFQQRNVSMERPEARKLNVEIYRGMYEAGMRANLKLGAERGEAPDMVGSGKRFAHMFAVAPNASSSIICGGVSPSREPILANAFTQKTLSGSHLVRNPALIPVLERYGKNDEETWTSIVINNGSVQHLQFLTLWERSIFKTAIELDQMVLVTLAADAQPFVCQAQSVNLFMPANVNVAILHKVHFAAWKLGLKSLYYLRSQAVKSTEAVGGRVERVIRADAPSVVKDTGYGDTGAGLDIAAGARIDPTDEGDCLACQA